MTMYMTITPALWRAETGETSHPAPWSVEDPAQRNKNESDRSGHQCSLRAFTHTGKHALTHVM